MPVAVLKLPVVLLKSALKPMAVLLKPVLLPEPMALSPKAVFPLESQALGHCACAVGESAKQVRTSGMRRKASRKGDHPIDFPKCRVVIFFVFIFFVEAELLNLR